MSLDRTARLNDGPLIPAVCQGPGVAGLVSVLIPSFNRAYILGPTLDSVLAQTYPHIEIVVVDDGSTDGTRELMAGYEARYGDRLRYIYQSNAGLAAARNAGLQAARGEFVAFQDSDDLWAPWKVDAQVALMRHEPSLALTWTDMTAVSPDGAVMQTHYLRRMYQVYREIDTAAYLDRSSSLAEVWPAAAADPVLANARVRWGDIYSAMFMGNLVHPPTALMRRTAVQQAGGLDLAFAWTCEDYEFFWRVLRHGGGGLIEAPGMLYRVDAPDQLTKPDLRLYLARGNLKAVEQCLDSGQPLALPARDVRDHLRYSHRWLAEEELFSPGGRRAVAVRSLQKVLSLSWPWERRMVALMVLAIAFPKPVVKWLRARRAIQRS